SRGTWTVELHRALTQWRSRDGSTLNEAIVSPSMRPAGPEQLATGRNLGGFPGAPVDTAPKGYPGLGRASAGVAVGVAGGIPALEAGLVDAQPAEVVAVGEEPLVGGQAAGVEVGIQLGQPGADPVGVE